MADKQPLVRNGLRRKLPFKTPGNMSLKPFEIVHDALGTLEVPRYNGALAGEIMDFTRAMQDKKRAELIAQVQGKTPAQIEELLRSGLNQMEMSSAMLEFAVESATIILQYRFDPAWTNEDTVALPSSVVNALSAILAEEMQYASKQAQAQTAAPAEEGDSPNDSSTPEA